MSTANEQPDWWGAHLLGRPADGAPWARARHSVGYRVLRARVAASRQVFDAYGIRSGSTVVLRSAHSFSQLWALFALWSRGAQVMLMGPRLHGAELGRLLDRCRPQFHVSFNTPGQDREIFHDECEIQVRRLVGGRPATTDHCLVQFTSGSTGHAKPIGRTPRSLLAELERFQAVGGTPEAGSRVLLLGPLAHSFTLVGGLLHAMNSGAEIVFARDSGDRTVLGTALRARVDTVIGAPRHFAALARTACPVRISRLRTAISGGESLDPRTQTRFAERYGVRIGQAYGTTETGIIAMDPTGWYGPDTVGMPTPRTVLRLVSGELHIRLDRSPYLLEEEAPARFLPLPGPTGAGWLCTRDVVERDAASGALRILGRFDPPADRAAPARGGARSPLAERTLVRQLARGGGQTGR